VVVAAVTIIVAVVILWKVSQYLYRRRRKARPALKFKGDESMSLINTLGESMEEYSTHDFWIFFFGFFCFSISGIIVYR
jgi:hypothetical protein